MPSNSIQHQMLLYTLVIAIMCATTLSFQILSMYGIILSNNAKLTIANQHALNDINDRILKSQIGTTKSATYNISAQNALVLKEMLGILKNSTR